MEFRLEITLGNDAMQDPQDVAYALQRMANEFGDARTRPFRQNDEGRIRDVNGNTVGSWAVSDDDENENAYFARATREEREVK